MSKKFAPNPTPSLRRVQSMRTGVSLSAIKNMSVDDIQVNPKNTVYFVRETSEYFQRLREDIEKRGVVVPLLIKQDGTLLAGHNRLHIAREIGLRFVPVQTVQEELTERQEQEFIINDNLLRRHLTIEERMHLYKILFPEFETILALGKRGGDKKSAAYKAVKKEHNQKDIVVLKKSSAQGAGEKPLTTIHDLAEKIAATTGQNISTVKQQITRAKRGSLTQEKSQRKTQTEKIASRGASAAKNNQNDSVVLIQRLDSVLQDVASAPSAVQSKVRKKLEKFLITL